MTCYKSWRGGGSWQQVEREHINNAHTSCIWWRVTSQRKAHCKKLREFDSLQKVLFWREHTHTDHATSYKRGSLEDLTLKVSKPDWDNLQSTDSIKINRPVPGIIYVRMYWTIFDSWLPFMQNKIFLKKHLQSFTFHIFTILLAPFASNLVNHLWHSEF